jgi:ABC-type bacteriocin/lantibiotic exporter with double-glycine peptidase domain
MRFQVRLSLTSASKFIDHIFKMPLQFFVQRLPGELCSRISSCDSVASLVSGQLIGGLINLFSTVFFFILMLMYDIPLTLISLFLSLIVVVIFRISSERIKNKTFKLQMEGGKLSGITMSGIEMIESLKASGSENDYFMQWSGQQAKVILENQRLLKTNTANFVTPKTITQVQNILILSIGALRVMDGQLTIGMLMAFQILLANFTGPVNSFMNLGADLLSANADMQRIDDVMDYELPKIFGEEKQKLEGYVTLKNVSFGYSPLEQPLITDLSFELSPGKRIAIVGTTGSGKTTIGKLACALYQPWSGEILFDGKALQQIEKKVFASSVAVVNQNTSLFEGSVKDNLTMWDSTVPEDC